MCTTTPSLPWPKEPAISLNRPRRPSLCRQAPPQLPCKSSLVSSARLMGKPACACLEEILGLPGVMVMMGDNQLACYKHLHDYKKRATHFLIAEYSGWSENEVDITDRRIFPQVPKECLFPIAPKRLGMD
jgi:hypothetical protein